jgi:release factor H-coupled RctB family protein
MEVNKFRLVGCSENDLEGAATAQLKGASTLTGLEQAVGFPDLHPGKTGPVGAAFACVNFIHPALIGNDVGCGMLFCCLDLSRHKMKLDRWEKKLDGLDQPWPGDGKTWLEKFNVDPRSASQTLGTIGGGNHFAEIQCLEQVVDEGLFAENQLDQRQLFALIHSGSREHGQALLHKHLSANGFNALPAESAAGEAYVAEHNAAVRWAFANRSLIAQRLAEAIGAAAHVVLDAPHNWVTQETIGDETFWLHRKGAASAALNLTIFPGSRGSFSFLAKPLRNEAENLFSLPHGAGRKWTRSDCKAHLESRYSPEDLRRTTLGGRVICEDRALLYEEAPQAYKNIERIVGKLEADGWIRVVAKLRPLLTYKCRRNNS